MRPARLASSALAIVALTLFSARTCHAQAPSQQADRTPAGLLFASAESPAIHTETHPAESSELGSLPDTPSFTAISHGVANDPGSGSGQSGNGGLAAGTPSKAKKWAPVILPTQSAQPLSQGDKVTFALRQSVSPFTFLSVVISATYSQGVDSAPHYGQGWAPYGQRIGAAAARNTVQTLAGQAVFAPLFHDDPRYYQLGRGHKLVNRAVYAATRVLVTRNDNGQQRVNIPLLGGYAVAAGVNNAFYPERDRGGKETAISYGSSLGGAVAGMEVSEFLSDALRIAHLSRFSR